VKHPRRLLVAVVVALGTAAVPLAIMAQAPENKGSVAVSRVERTFSFSRGWLWGSHCEGGEFVVCLGVATPVRVPVRMPADQATVDVTLTVTLDYVTTPDTAVIAGARIEGRTFPGMRMRPGGFPLAPSTRPTTTTLTWIRRDLPAAGRTYTFKMGVSARSLVGETNFSARGRKITAVIETWSAGD
jgi:hypothetical protein